MLTRRFYFTHGLLGNATSALAWFAGGHRRHVGLSSWLLMVCVWLAGSAASAQPAPPIRLLTPGPMLLAPASPQARFARVGSWVGLVGAGALLSGSLAIALGDDPNDERLVRGLQLGLTAVTAPFVALAGWTVRRHSYVEGYPVARSLSWASYTIAIAIEANSLWGAFNDVPTSRGQDIAMGVAATLSVLPLAFDSYVCARQSRIPSVLLSVTPLGIHGRF